MEVQQQPQLLNNDEDVSVLPFFQHYFKSYVDDEGVIMSGSMHCTVIS